MPIVRVARGRVSLAAVALVICQNIALACSVAAVDRGRSIGNAAYRKRVASSQVIDGIGHSADRIGVARQGRMRQRPDVERVCLVVCALVGKWTIPPGLGYLTDVSRNDGSLVLKAMENRRQEIPLADLSGCGRRRRCPRVGRRPRGNARQGKGHHGGNERRQEGFHGVRLSWLLGHPVISEQTHSHTRC